MDPLIENRITITGPAAELKVIARDLAEEHECDAVSFDGRCVTCYEYTIGYPCVGLLVELSSNHHRVTVGHVWWTEDAEEHGCGIYVLGTTEFEWWGEGMTLVDEDDYDCWEDAVAAEAQHQHGGIVESFLSLAEPAEPGTG